MGDSAFGAETGTSAIESTKVEAGDETGIEGGDSWKVSSSTIDDRELWLDWSSVAGTIRCWVVDPVDDCELVLRGITGRLFDDFEVAMTLFRDVAGLLALPPEGTVGT